MKRASKKGDIENKGADEWFRTNNRNDRRQVSKGECPPETGSIFSPNQNYAVPTAKATECSVCGDDREAETTATDTSPKGCWICRDTVNESKEQAKEQQGAPEGVKATVMQSGAASSSGGSGEAAGEQ